MHETKTEREKVHRTISEECLRIPIRPGTWLTDESHAPNMQVIMQTLLTALL